MRGTFVPCLDDNDHEILVYITPEGRVRRDVEQVRDELKLFTNKADDAVDLDLMMAPENDATVEAEIRQAMHDRKRSNAPQEEWDCDAVDDEDEEEEEKEDEDEAVHPSPNKRRKRAVDDEDKDYEEDPEDDNDTTTTEEDEPTSEEEDEPTEDENDEDSDCGDCDTETDAEDNTNEDNLPAGLLSSPPPSDLPLGIVPVEVEPLRVPSASPTDTTRSNSVV